MKTQLFKRILFCIPVFCMNMACSDMEREVPGPGKDQNELQLTYIIPGPDVQTYAVPALPVECEVEELYTLFFRPATHPSAPNQYVDYTRSTVTSNGTSGTSRITMPAGEDVDEGWQLVFIANLERYANLDGAPDVHTWLGSKLKPNGVTGLVLDQARPLLTAIAGTNDGMSVSLPMSAEISKPAGTNAASITFSRRVARIDVINTASNFEMVNARIWNTRRYGFLMDDGSVMTGTASADYISYSNQVVTATATQNGQEIEGGMYAFPNIVPSPGATDSQTTYLVIGGRYNGSSAITYYRVNVCPDDASQYIQGNGVYVVDIHNVAGSGSSAPASPVTNRMEYTINEWEDGYRTDYLFDADGNGLAVTQRFATFSESGGQTIDIQLLRIPATLDPATWNVGPVTGTDNTLFTAAKKPGDPDNSWVQLTAPFENATTIDREAQVNITWGNLSLPIYIRQLSPASRMDGIQASPYDIWFRPEGETKEVNLQILGDLTGITSSSITYTILYEQGATGWITNVAYNSSGSNTATGLYNYRITTSLLGSQPRQATIKFVVTRGARISTASIIIRQSQVDTGGGDARRLSVNVLERTNVNTDTYADLGTLTDWHAKVQGLPSSFQGTNHLIFPFVEYKQIKYRFTILSAQDWKIVKPGQAAGAVYTGMDGAAGDPFTTHSFDVSAISDVTSAWDGEFYIEYADGLQTRFVVHQSGTLKTLGQTTQINDGRMYYYGTFRMNGKLWLDRNIGASVGMDPDDPTIGFYGHNNTGITNDERAPGVAFPSRLLATASCPAGFRLPKRLNGNGEFDWLFNNIYFSGTTAGGDGIVQYPWVWYVILSNNPDKFFFLPATSDPMRTFYWTYETGYLQLYNGAKEFKITDYMSSRVRCIRE